MKTDIMMASTLSCVIEKYTLSYCYSNEEEESSPLSLKDLSIDILPVHDIFTNVSTKVDFSLLAFGSCQRTFHSNIIRQC